MDESKCKECGGVLEQGATECSSCGCPVEEVKIQNDLSINKEPIKKYDIKSYISLSLGILIIIIGLIVSFRSASINTHTANIYSVRSVSFGADFYTEIYNASDTMVDELNEINKGIGVLSKSSDDIINAIYFSSGMLIIAIGIAVIAVSLNTLQKEK